MFAKHISKSPSVGSHQEAAQVMTSHWSNHLHEVLVSQTVDGLNPIIVLGGAENGQFCWIGDVAHDRLQYHNEGQMHAGDILLEIQGQHVAGFTLSDIVEWITYACRNQSPVLFKVTSPDVLTKDLKEFLNTRFQKGSKDHVLQQVIRTNIYKRTVPCTTRPPRKGEVDGVDYRFLTVDEFETLEKSGDLLESGIFDDNYYGTPKPPKLPAGSSLHSAASDSSVRRSGSTGDVTAVGLHPTSNGKRQRNRSNVETSGGSQLNNTNATEPLHNIYEPFGGQVLQRNKSMERLHSGANITSVGATSWDGGARHLPEVAGDAEQFHGAESSDASDELPYGWERVDDPTYGVYYIDHINRRTQYENPVVKSKKVLRTDRISFPDSPRSEQPSLRSGIIESNDKSPPAYAVLRRNFFTRDPNKLHGQFVTTKLVKSVRGLGFTIVGGSDEDGDCEEFLQIKSIAPSGPAASDGQLKRSDVLVFVDDKCVLGYSHHDVIELFQSIPVGETVTLEVCRGYSLPFDPDDPNNEVITTVAVTAPQMLPHGGKGDSLVARTPTYDLDITGSLNGDGRESPNLLTVDIVKGPMGFGFTIADSAYGQRVKQILDRPRCIGLSEGDLLVNIGGTLVRDYQHGQVVDVLKSCSVGSTVAFVVQRGGILPRNLKKSSSKSPITVRDEHPNRSPQTSNELGTRYLSADVRHDRTPSSTVEQIPPPGLPTADAEPIYAIAKRPTKSPAFGDTSQPDSRCQMESFSSGISGVRQQMPPLESKITRGQDIRNSYHAEHSRWVMEEPPGVTTGDLPRRPLQRGHSMHNEQGTSGFRYPAEKVDDEPAPDSVGVLGRNMQNQMSFNGRDVVDYPHAGPNRAASARIRSKTPGPEFMRGVRAEYGGEEDGPPHVPPKSWMRSKTPTMENHGVQRPTRRTPQPISGTPNFIPASLYTGHPSAAETLDAVGSSDSNWRSTQSYAPSSVTWSPANYNAKMSSSSVSSGVQGSPLTDSTSRMGPTHTVLRPPVGSWTDSPVSTATARTQLDEQFFEMPVYLQRMETGFGFRIIGGTEEGSQVSVGHVVPRGAADIDGHIRQGDEITYVDGTCVIGSSHRKVVQLMSDASQNGRVTLRIRRYAGRSLDDGFGITKFNYPYEVTLSRQESEGFGFVLVSSATRTGAVIGKIVSGSPAERSEALQVGSRVLAVNSVTVASMHHEQIVMMIKESGLSVVLTIGPPEEPYDGGMTSFSVSSVPLTNSAMTSFGSQSESGMSRHSDYSPYRASPLQLQPHLASSKNASQKSISDSSIQQDQKLLHQQHPGAESSAGGAPSERLYTIELQRGARGFGFSIRGGREFNNMPLFILKIADGGAAHVDGRLRVGDQILEINGRGTQNMMHSEAIDLIQAGNSTVRLLVKRTPTIRQPAAGRAVNGLEPQTTSWSHPARNAQPVSDAGQPQWSYGQLAGKYQATTYR